MTKDTDDFLPAEERRLILRQYGKKFGLNIFIETGTNNGDTPWFLQDDFNELHTIELGKAQFLAARERFRHVPQVTCYHGDSTTQLAAVLSEITEPALIWLDGHYSGPGTASGTQNCPAMDEIRAIIADGRPHVVLVDDARCFYGGQHNPIGGNPMYDHYSTWDSLENVQALAESGGYTFVIKDDIIRLTP